MLFSILIHDDKVTEKNGYMQQSIIAEMQGNKHRNPPDPKDKGTNELDVGYTQLKPKEIVCLPAYTFPQKGIAVLMEQSF